MRPVDWNVLMLNHLSLNAKTNPSPTFGMWQACKGIRGESKNNLKDWWNHPK